MKFFLIMILLFCVNNLFAQKDVIDSIAYKQWSSLGLPTISENGQYLYYSIENVPVGSQTVVVQSTQGKWKKELKGEQKASFLSKKYFLFITKNDSLGILTLGTDQIKYIPNTSWCSLRNIKGLEYLWYPSGINQKNLILRNLESTKEISFSNVESWSFDKDMLVLFKSIHSNDQRKSINLADVISGELSKIWEGYKPENLVLDAMHRQLAFKTGDSVWYYKIGSANAVCISNKNAPIIDTLTLGGLESFSKDGKLLFTSLIAKVGIIKPKNEAVEVWSYADVKLQTEQENAVSDGKYLAVIDIEDCRIIRLQRQQKEWFRFPTSVNSSSVWALVENSKNLLDPWSIGYKCSWSLVNTKNGERKDLAQLNRLVGVQLSPYGKYVVYFDAEKKNYFSYEIATDRICNLTKDIPDISSPDKWSNAPLIVKLPRGIAGWSKNDESVLLYDQHDIWELNLSNKKRAVNITNGYGKRNGLVFHLALKEYDEQSINKGEPLILNSFDLKSKNNGYYSKRIGKNGDPDLLCNGPYIFDLRNAGYLPGDVNFPPCKATKSEMYIVRRMSATDAPNYFSTKDFKTFIRLSNLQPQKKYNWYTTELHTWKSLDGRILQGILYKPENFDPNKRYPVIFHYYQRKSDGLNCYIKPDKLNDGGNINISTYVSHGYLVFSPDIYYTEGDPMQGTYNAMVSAANYVSTLPFVNARKMGIQGNSFGGVQTNYLVTHTNLFAAAESSSGVADFVSSYGSLMDAGTGASEQGFHENGQIRMGGSLWEKPEAYIKNSSIFSVSQVTTPLLLMHTKKDGICGYPNVMEFFTGLRRMGKRAWMLVYSEGNHGLGEKVEVDDFSIRMMQFFDHYLKDKPAPLWMVDGVLAKDRSWKAGLELDTKGRTPGTGLLTPEEQKKVDSLMTRGPITITLK